MLVENGTQIKALAAAQRATDKKLDVLTATVDRFIRSLERGGGKDQRERIQVTILLERA